MRLHKLSRFVIVALCLLLAIPLAGAQDTIELSWITDLPGAEEVAARFTEYNPNVTVRVDKVSFREVFQQNQIRLGSGSPEPDIVSVDAPVVASYGFRGWLLPLEDMIPAEQIDGWVDALHTSSIYDGHLLAPPIWNSAQVMYYNADLLEAAGIAPPAHDERWTWEQVTDAAVALANDADADGVNDVWGLQFGQYNRIYQLQPIPESLPTAVLGDDALTVEGIIDSEDWVKAFTWFGDLHNSLNVSPQGGISSGELFRNQQLGLYVDGGWMINQFIGNPVDFNWGVAPHPYWDGGEITVPRRQLAPGRQPQQRTRRRSGRFCRFRQLAGSRAHLV